MRFKLAAVILESWSFIRRHWLHLFLFAPGAILVTILHESAHALAVGLQGGTVSRFVWLPTGGKWGFVKYSFPEVDRVSSLVVSLAPYCVWLLFAILALVLGRARSTGGYWKASLIYMWLFVVPLADIANTAFPYLAGRQNDFSSAFGPPTIFGTMLILFLASMSLVVGYDLQSRLYGQNGLKGPSYAALSGLSLISILILTVELPG